MQATKLLRCLAALMLAMGPAATAAAQSDNTFEISQNFDKSTDFSGGKAVPDGWRSIGQFAFSRMRASDNGTRAHSGSYVLGTISNTTTANRNEKVYTPMMHLDKGQPCEISFYLYAPGGTPSFARKNQIVVNAKTAQEEDAASFYVGETEMGIFDAYAPCTFTFTPKTAGDYCFELSLVAALASCGAVSIDDICIKGLPGGDEEPEPDEPTLKPDPDNAENAIALPYLESFDNENDNYLGDSYLPQYWYATGTAPFVTANIDGLPAHTGTYYAIAVGDGQTERDERLYTPFFILEAGREYEMSTFVHMEKGSTDACPTLQVSVGTQQEADFQIPLLHLAEYTNEGWEPVSVKFTPELSGPYCFSFALTGAADMTGFVAIDDVFVTSEGMMLQPRADFRISHLYDFADGGMIAFKDEPVRMHNFSEYATAYEWSVDGGKCSISDATAKEPLIFFEESGNFNITLTAKNAAGERSASQLVSIDFIDYNKDNYGITSCPQEDSYLNRENLPAFDTDEQDYITGPNHYYRRIAERFALGEGVTTQIQNINVVLTHLNFKVKDNSREEQLAAKFSVVVYGETDDKLDETIIYGRYDSTLSEVFGTSGIGIGYGESRNISLPTPIPVSGPCYIAFEYGDDIDISIDDSYAGRTYAGLQAVSHASECTTLYVKPDSLPEASAATVGEWCLLDELAPEYKGTGLWMLIWVSSKKSTAIALNSMGETVLAVRPAQNGLEICGTQPGETVAIYNAAGQLVQTTTATEGSTLVSLSDALRGVLMVKTNAGCVKMVR